MRLKQVVNNALHLLKIIEKDHKSIKVLLIATSFTSAILPYINFIYSANILDSLIGKYYKLAFSKVVVMLILNLCISIINRGCRKYLDTVSEMSQYDIEKQATVKAFSIEYEEFEKKDTLDSIRSTEQGVRSSGGVDSYINDICVLLENILKASFGIIMIILLFTKIDNNNNNFVTSYYFTFIIIGIYMLILFICMKLINKSNVFMGKMLHKNETVNSVSAYLMGSCTDYKNGLDIRVFNMKDYLSKKLSELLKQIDRLYLDWGINDGRIYGIFGFLTQMAAGIAYVFVGVKAIYGLISIGDVLMYTGAILNFITCFKELISLYGRISFVGEYLNNYTEFINKPNLNYNGSISIKKRNDNVYEFEFKDVSFKYPNTNILVLDHINFKIKEGEKLAVVGQNGAGKTTVIKLLCRLYEPTSGEILLNGTDIRKYDYEEYMDLFSVVFQDFKLYSLSIEENIAGSLNMDYYKIMDSLDKIGIKNKVMSLREKASSRLYKDNGNGIEVSGGEAQKIAIARALYKDAPFVILDEPTSALDPISEADIYKNFSVLVKNKSAIYISHRMSSCKFCDNIIVFKKGKVVEQGSHEELLNLNGEYAKLFNSQAKYYVDKYINPKLE